MTIESEQAKHSRERAEVHAREQREAKESKEQEIDPELLAAAAMERADYLVKEVRSSKKQMQNILLHIGQVRAAIKELRALLDLPENGMDAASVGQDHSRAETLRKQIAEYQEELVNMREDLIRAQIEELKKGTAVGLSMNEIVTKATAEVDEMIRIATKA